MSARSKNAMDLRVGLEQVGDMLHHATRHHQVDGSAVDFHVAEVTLVQLHTRQVGIEVNKIDADELLRAPAKLQQHGRTTAAAGVEQCIIGKEVTFHLVFEDPVGVELGSEILPK